MERLARPSSDEAGHHRPPNTLNQVLRDEGVATAPKAPSTDPGALSGIGRANARVICRYLEQSA